MMPLTKTSTTKLLSSPLRLIDPQLYKLVETERARQVHSISLIASENYIPRYCSDVLASCLSSKYSEGLPGERYYAGNEIIDQVEQLCQDRALAAFKLDKKVWDVNVQALSGSPANFAVFTGLLEPGSRILYLDLPHGGHLSHGFHTADRNVTATSKYFKCEAYHLDPATGLIDYEELAKTAKRFKPHMIIAGCSCYPRLIEYEKFRKAADSVGALLLGDIAHIAGLMAGGVIPSAFPFCDVVTTTTHKTLRGPRGSLIFMRKHLAPSVNAAVFPGCQGGPHNHTIGAVAAAMLAAQSEEFRDYTKQILSNATALASRLQKRGYKLATGGTDTHLLLVDLTDKGTSGAKAEKILEAVNIVCNKNTVLSDKSPKNPSGIRLGTPAMTSRGFDEKAFEQVADYISTALQVAQSIQKGPMTLKTFVKRIEANRDLEQLRTEVIEFVSKYPCVASALWPGN